MLRNGRLSRFVNLASFPALGSEFEWHTFLGRPFRLPASSATLQIGQLLLWPFEDPCLERQQPCSLPHISH